jgi:hypothetical protein
MGVPLNHPFKEDFPLIIYKPSSYWGFTIYGNHHIKPYLVGVLEHEFYFPSYIWDVILPIWLIIFFRL